MKDWLRLQRKIFSRYVAQKLSKRGFKVDDVVVECGNGLLLIHLMEVMSEKSYPDTKYWDNLQKKPPTSRPQQIDAVSNALKVN
jgi:hypothetical protein